MSEYTKQNPHRDHSRFEQNWAEAVAWRREMEDKYNRDFVGEVATKELTMDYEGSGQGISSSDINHRCFSIWQSFKDTEGQHTSDLAFLVDYNWEI